MTKKIIIDTDPGIDDAMAILFAHLSPDVEIVGLTTIFGNVPVEQATQNALFLVELMEQEIPVAQGSSKPLVKVIKQYPDFIHGKNGFGDIQLDPPKQKAVKKDAADFIIEQIKSNPGEITLVPIGPLTNIALALEKDPGITKGVKEVVIMGGAATVNGNVNPAAEANMLGDPHAADKVFSANWPLTMIGLDVTHQVVMTESFLDSVHNHTGKLGQFLHQISKLYLDFHQSIGKQGLYTHDPSTIAYLIQPTLFKTVKGEIRVNTEGVGMGQTIMNSGINSYFETPWSGIPKTNVCVEVDEEAFLKLYENVMKGH